MPSPNCPQGYHDALYEQSGYVDWLLWTAVPGNRNSAVTPARTWLRYRGNTVYTFSPGRGQLRRYAGCGYAKGYNV